MALENKKQLFIIVGAVAAGIIATVLTSNYVKNTIQNQTAELAANYEARQKEAMAASDQKMAAVDAKIENMRAENEEALKKQAEELKAAQQTAMQAAQQAAQQTAQVRKARKPSLALKTPVGKRAVTVMIDSLSAVGGLLNAGDSVDVIAHLNVPGAEGKDTVTAMIFQSLQVLAINTNLDDPGAYDEQQGAGSLKITFAVDPQESGLLAFAEKNGKLELALRSPEEKEQQMVKASTWKTLAEYVLEKQGANIQNPDEKDAESPTDTKPTIQIFRGGKEL